MRWPAPFGTFAPLAVELLALMSLASGASCRRQTSPRDDAGPAPPSRHDAADAAASKTATFARFTRPVAALRSGAGFAVVGRDRTTQRFQVARLEDGAPSPTEIAPLPIAFENPDIFGSPAALAISGPGSADSGEGRLLLRGVAEGDAGIRWSEPVSLGGAACSTTEGVYALAREATGWRGTFFPLAGAAGEARGPLLAGRAQATVVCGQQGAFVVLSEEGELRASRWTPAEHDPGPVSLPTVPAPASDEDTLMASIDDKLVVAKLRASALYTLVWQNEKKPAAWRKAELISKERLTLEAIEPGHDRIGLLFLRTIGKAKGCPSGEATDAIAEVAIVDETSGQFIHAPEAIETWRCGAEPGPFFSGWANNKLMVAWPRGADAACLLAGVRRGGVGYAEVDARPGRARVANIARAAETIVGAGCDGPRCYAIAVTRGSDPCGPADAPDAGRLEVIAYPQY